jgi:acetoin utilization deacetylase AcuC-like enzyme
MSQQTGFVWHELYAWHNTGNPAGYVRSSLHVQPGEHMENAETKRRFQNLVAVSDLSKKLAYVEPRMATMDELRRYHTTEYIESIKSASANQGGDAGFGTPFGQGSFEIAQLATGGCLSITEAVLKRECKNGYALVRPPGHHAMRDSGMGCCIFANVALSVMHAKETFSTDRIAVVDWDVHHGNGTQDAFYDDPSVLTISVHQQGFLGLAGNVDETGNGAGRGTNLNIPLPAGSGSGAYEAAIERVVVPALRNFKPEMIFVACGFDASAMDPMGRMMCTSETYRKMTRAIKSAAADLCDGRLVMCHEGGYSAVYVPYCGLAVVEELSGHKTEIDDPFLRAYAGVGGEDLQPHQDQVICDVEAVLSEQFLP